MKNYLTVKLSSNQEIKVYRLALGKYAEILKCLDTLPTKLGKLQTTTQDDIFKNLSVIIADSMPEIAKIISIGTDATEDQVLNEFDLNDLVNVLQASFELNKFREVVDNLKKLQAGGRG